MIDFDFNTYALHIWTLDDVFFIQGTYSKDFVIIKDSEFGPIVSMCEEEHSSVFTGFKKANTPITRFFETKKIKDILHVPKDIVRVIIYKGEYFVITPVLFISKNKISIDSSIVFNNIYDEAQFVDMKIKTSVK